MCEFDRFRPETWGLVLLRDCTCGLLVDLRKSRGTRGVGAGVEMGTGIGIGIRIEIEIGIEIGKGMEYE